MASTREMRFLALCLPGSPQSDSSSAEDLTLLDWSALVEAARWHGMMPLLASRVLPSPTRFKVPPTSFIDMRRHQERHLIRSLARSAALIELQQEFDRSGLKIISWKGPSLGLLLYGSPTLRDSSDLDFLFLKEHIQTVLKITQLLGYKLLGSTPSESKDLYISALQREFTFGRERDQLALEFHLQVLPSQFTLWQDSQKDIGRASTICALGDVKLLMQDPADLLVSLCAHATKHDWDRMKWSCDIAQFLKIYGSTLPWPRLLTTLQKERKAGVVLLGLALADKLFALTLPPAVSEALSPEVITLADDLAAHLLSGSTEPVSLPQRRMIVSLLCPRLRDRIAYTALPVVELNYEDLHVPVRNRLFFFMNYAFRVVRLMRKYGLHRLATKTAAAIRSVR